MKFSILLSLLFDLLSQRKITATYIAQKHGVSTRTAYRYVEELSASVPVYIKRGRNGGIYISDCFKLPSDFLTEKEYIGAIEGLELAYAKNPKPHYLTAKKKFSSASKRETQKIDVSGEMGCLLIDSETFNNAPRTLEKLRFWEERIKKRTLVEIVFQTETSKIEERIEPHAIVFSKGIWQLYAFCHNERSFKLLPIGQIRSALQTNQTFRARPFNRKNVIAGEPAPIPLVHVRLEIYHPALLTETQNRLDAENIRKQKGKWIADLTLPDNEELPRWFLRLGSQAKVISPLSLQKRIGELAKEISKIYDEN